MKFMESTWPRTKSVLLTRSILVAAAIMLLAGSAHAGVITQFSGKDNGAPITGPFTNSAAAATSFQTAASAFGTLNTITFESQPTGFNPSFTAAPGVTVTLNASNLGSGISGINNVTNGNAWGFNTTAGGSQWLGFPTGSATFAFATATNSFGFYLTGLQENTFGTVVTVSFSDGSSQAFNAPITVNGGAEYFGFTDTASISSLTITSLNRGDDWGIDDVTYNSGPNTSPVPEPSSLLLLGTGALGLIGAVRRKAGI